MKETIAALAFMGITSLTGLMLNAKPSASSVTRPSQVKQASQGFLVVDPKEMDLLKRKHGFLKQKNARLAQHLKSFQAREIAVINALHEMTQAKDQKCPEDVRKLLQIILDKG